MSQIVLDIIRYFLSSGATHVHTFPTSCGVNLLTILLITSSVSRWTGWTCVKAKPQRWIGCSVQSKQITIPGFRQLSPFPTSSFGASPDMSRVVQPVKQTFNWWCIHLEKGITKPPITLQNAKCQGFLWGLSFVFIFTLHATVGTWK